MLVKKQSQKVSQSIEQGSDNARYSKRRYFAANYNFVDNLLLGRFTLVEIAKVTGISEQLLQSYLNTKSILEPQEVLSSN